MKTKSIWVELTGDDGVNRMYEYEFVFEEM